MIEAGTPIVAVLVHGTFARDSEWCRPDSEFRADLNRWLGGNVRFVRFRWSGWNLHRARIKAGTRLATHLARVVSAYPTAKIVVIGHSHGGNVIRYAFRQVGTDTAQRVAGVVTLGTPFVMAEPRQYLGWLRRLVIFCAIGALALSFLLAFSFILFGIFYSIEHRSVVGLVLILGAPFAIVPCVLLIFGLLRLIYLNRLSRFATFLANRLESFQRQLVETIDPPTLDGVPLLTIEVRADEARFALSASAILSEWAHKTLRNDSRNLFLATTVLPVLLMSLSVGLAIAYVPSLFSLLFWPRLSFTGLINSLRTLGGLYVLALSLGLAVAPLLVALLLMVSVAVPRAVKAPIFGEETLYESWLVRSVHSATPVGWTPHTHHLVAINRSWSQLGLYRHSLICETPEVTEFIASWISDRSMNRTLKTGWVGKQEHSFEALVDFEGIPPALKEAIRSEMNEPREPRKKVSDSPYWESTGTVHSIWNLKDRPPMGF